MEFISHSEAETEALGEKLARTLPERGVVIAMYGELGAGKTAFVRGLARGLEVDGVVTSPTFTIVNELYGKRDLFHFDMYRLGSADELFDIGWEDYLDRGGVCALEWSENVPGAFDGSEIRVGRAFADTGNRDLRESLLRRALPRWGTACAEL